MGEIATKQQAAAVHQLQSESVMTAIIHAAQNADVDPGKMERMMAMYERMEAKKAEAAFNHAMSVCQKQMRRVSADATNPQTRSAYATYAALDRALRPIYTDAGLSLSFDTGEAPEGYVRVLCYVAHEEGHSRTYKVDMPADGMGAKGNAVMTKTHAAGSAMSYGMRYLLKLIFNVAVGEDDDDGNAASTPVETITESQAADIKALAEEVQADVPKFLQYLSKLGKRRIGSIEEIPAKMFRDATAAMAAKRKRNEYPAERFEESFPKWKAAIQSKARTHDDIINLVQSTYVLTNEQKQKIRDIKESNNENS